MAKFIEVHTETAMRGRLPIFINVDQIIKVLPINPYRPPFYKCHINTKDSESIEVLETYERVKNLIEFDKEVADVME